MFPFTIYHNPACGAARNTLAMIRAAGIEPTVIEYLKTPATRDDTRRPNDSLFQSFGRLV